MMRYRKVIWGVSAAILFTSQVAFGGKTNETKISFDTPDVLYQVKSGRASIESDGAKKGCALKLASDSEVGIKVRLKPNSVYLFSLWMRTESGADNVSVKLTGDNINSISAASALATWTKVEREVEVKDNGEATIQLIFPETPNKTYGWFDEIEFIRLRDYKLGNVTGFPSPKKREVITDMGVSMQPDDKISWMLDSRLGMFIHWGLYSGPGRGEWYMENAGIDPETYRTLAYPQSGEEYFAASKFDANEWIDLAVKSGMKYVNMVTQHHDGYALFESSYMNAFTAKQTHNRDFVKEYVDACRKAGLKVGLYKTLINWRFPGYYDIYGNDCKPNKFGYTTDSLHRENARLMKEELYCQIKELMTKYGKIDQLFWDGGWIGQKGSDADGAPFWESGMYMSDGNPWQINPYFRDYDDNGKALGLMGIVRKYQPDIVANPRSGWCGDYTCEEGAGSVTGPIRSGVVEKCVSLSPGWGYNKMMEDSTKVMALSKVKRLCADCMVRNMCFLVNIGPDRFGVVPKYTRQRMLEFGDWVSRVGDAIYGTRGGPWEPVEDQYGFTYKNNKIFVYFLGGYDKDSFTIPELDPGMNIVSAKNLSDNENIEVQQSGKKVTLRNLSLQKDDIVVIALELDRPVYPSYLTMK